MLSYTFHTNSQTVLGTLILTVDNSAFVIVKRLVGGVTGRQGMLTPPGHVIPLSVCPGVRVSQFLSLTCNSYLCFETDHPLVS
jgi:hypothetical protein